MKRPLSSKKDGPTDTDKSIGVRLRNRRSMLGMTQEDLGKSVGITFQQIQKYEMARNRVSASRLFQLSQKLSVPITYFFERLDQSDMRPGLAEDQEPFAAITEDKINSRETVELIRTYYSIDDPKLRKDLLKFLKQMAAKMIDKQGD